MAKAKNSPVLITGVAGFIGFHVAKALLDRQQSVVGVDNLNNYYDTKLKQARLQILEESPNFHFQKIDIAIPGEIERVFEETKPEVVIHLAAQPGVRYSLENPNAYEQSNLAAFLNVLEACREHQPRHLVFASSSSVYGIGSEVPYRVEERSDHPVSLYAATKKANEVMAHSYSHLFDVPMTGLRFFTVYGPWGRPDMAVYSFAEAIKAGRKIRLFNNGDLRRDFTYVDDIVDGILRIADAQPPAVGLPDTGGSTDAPFRIYNIGNNQPVPVPELISILEELIGKRAEIELTEMQPGDVYETYADIEPIKRDYGFVPRTGLREGLSEFVRWHDDYTKRSVDP